MHTVVNVPSWVLVEGGAMGHTLGILKNKFEK